MKLNLLLDKTNEFNPKGALVFQDENSYFEAFIKIYESLDSNVDLIVITRSLALRELIKSAFIVYKFVDLIENQEITYKTLLSKNWNISEYDFIPSDKEIKDYKLLEFDFRSDNPDTFSSIIISNFVSIHLAGSTIPIKNFGNLLNDIIKYKEKESSIPQIVKRVLLYKHALLLKNDTVSKELLNQLFDNPIELFDNSCLYLLIERYPDSFREKLMDKTWSKLLSGVNLKDIDLLFYFKNSTSFLRLKKELDIYFSGIKDKFDFKSFSESIDSSSGYLIEEFNSFIRILKSKSEFITPKILKQIELKFSKLGGDIPAQLEILSDNIMPDFDLPEFNSRQDLDSIVSDAVKFYYPYKIWSDNSGIIENRIILWGKLFSEYVLNEYEKISYHYDKFIHRFIHNNNQLIRQTELVLILIIDNLNYKYFKYLQEAFKKHNIIIKDEPDPYLSLLPTTTSVGKFAVISGSRDKIDSSKTTYQPIIKENWQNYFPEHYLYYYHSDLADIVNHEVNGKEIIFINYIGVDQELHSSSKKTLIDHKEQVKINLEKLSDILTHFIKRNRKEDVVKLFFISDHGSTLIPVTYPNSEELEYFNNFKEGADLKPDHRFIKVDKKEFENFKNNPNISNEVFCLSSQVSGDGNNYIIAKGYRRFKKVAIDAYVHGGATPEEMIIPAGYFIFRKAEYDELIIQLTKNEFRYMVLESFPIRLANPNEKPIDQIQIKIFENEIPKITLYDNDSLPSKGEMLIEAKFKLSKKDNSSIRVAVSYTIDGINCNIDYEFLIKVKSMVETKSDMDNLLEL